MDDFDDVPEGFERIDHRSPFMRLVGPLFVKRRAEGTVVGMRIAERHLNAGGIVHGGLLATLVDSAFANVMFLQQVTSKPMVTVSLSIDYMDVVRGGDWVEAYVDVLRVGGRFAFANCFLIAGERRVLRASGVFAVALPVDAAAAGSQGKSAG